jgi:uncharacterized Zn finger protein
MELVAKILVNVACPGCGTEMQLITSAGTNQPVKCTNTACIHVGRVFIITTPPTVTLEGSV